MTQSLRAHLEWQAVCGTTGIPRDPEAKQRVAQYWAAIETERREAQLREALAEPSEPSQASEAELPARQPERESASVEQAVYRQDSALQPGEPRAFEPRAYEPQSKGGAGLSPALQSAVAQPVALPVVQRSLEEVQAEVRACTRCELSLTRTQTVFSRGTGASGLCFVGEGPGADEDAQGFPFVGKAGKLLDDMIRAMGFERDEVYVCNIVKCRPPGNRKPQEEEMAACRSYVVEQLQILKPEVIVALGGTAVEGLLGIKQGITRLRGRFLLYQGRTAVMPTFHPAYLLRNPQAKRDVWSDLKQVVRHMGRDIPVSKKG